METAFLASLIEPAEPNLNVPDQVREDGGPFASLVEERMFEGNTAGEAGVPEPGTGTASARARKPEVRAEKANFAPEYFFPAVPLPIEPLTPQAPPCRNAESRIPEPARVESAAPAGTPDDPDLFKDASTALCAPADTSHAPPPTAGTILTVRDDLTPLPPQESAAGIIHVRKGVKPAEFERPDGMERRFQREIETDRDGDRAAIEPVSGMKLEGKEPGVPQSGPPPETRPAPGSPPLTEVRPSRPRESAAAVRPPAVPSAKESGKTDAAPDLVASGSSEERTRREPMRTAEVWAPASRDEPRRWETVPEAAVSGELHPNVPAPAKAEANRTGAPAPLRLDPQLRMEPASAPAAGSASAPPHSVRIELPLGEDGAVRAQIIATPAAVQVTMRATDPGVQMEIHRYAPQLQSRLEEMQRTAEPVRENWGPPAYEAASAMNAVSPESFAGSESGAGGTRHPLPGEERDGGFGHRRQRREAEQEEEEDIR
jgi:hypothetical protein